MIGDAAALPRRQGDGGRALAEVRAIMDRRVGVVRDAVGLREAIARLHVLSEGGSNAALTA